MHQREYWERHGRAFDSLYERPTWFNRHFRQALFVRAEMARQAVSAIPGASVLDVGCGSGRNSILLVQEAGAARVTGVDIAEDMLSIARKLAGEHGAADRCTFVRGDFLNTDLDAQTFDVSVALGVLDYFRDGLPLLAKMRRHTARVSLATFPGRSILRMALRKVRYSLRGCGVYCYRKPEIERLYREAGFAACRVVRCTSAGWMGYGYVDPADALPEKRSE